MTIYSMIKTYETKYGGTDLVFLALGKLGQWVSRVQEQPGLHNEIISKTRKKPKTQTVRN